MKVEEIKIGYSTKDKNIKKKNKIHMDSAKLKAKELVDRYKGVAKYGQRQWGQTSYAKQAALICVDEILKEVKDAWKKLGMGEIGALEQYIPYDFWQSVKQEIPNVN